VGLAGFRGEPSRPAADAPAPLHIRGTVNFLFLGGILAAVLLQPRLPHGAAEVVMLAMLHLSRRFTPAGLREENGFNLGADPGGGESSSPASS